MTFHTWLRNASTRYIAANNVQPCECTACGEPVPPLERVIRQSHHIDGRRVKRLGLSDMCPRCRKKGTNYLPGRNVKPWGDFDFTEWAEATLYPGVPYMEMTWEERQHCYWLARLRWAAEGKYAALMGAEKKGLPELAMEERRRLSALRLTLARHGRRVTGLPYTEWLDGNDYADDHGRDAGAPARGRDDADAGGDAQGEKAPWEDGAAA